MMLSEDGKNLAESTEPLNLLLRFFFLGFTTTVVNGRRKPGGAPPVATRSSMSSIAADTQRERERRDGSPVLASTGAAIGGSLCLSESALSVQPARPKTQRIHKALLGGLAGRQMQNYNCCGSRKGHLIKLWGKNDNHAEFLTRTGIYHYGPYRII